MNDKIEGLKGTVDEFDHAIESDSFQLVSPFPYGNA